MAQIFTVSFFIYYFLNTLKLIAKFNLENYS